MYWYICNLLLGWHPAAVTHCTLTQNIYVDVLLHLLSAVWLTTCGSNTEHIYTKLYVVVLIHLLTIVGLTPRAVTHYIFAHKMHVHMLILLLKISGLISCCSNTVHIYTHYWMLMCWHNSYVQLGCHPAEVKQYIFKTNYISVFRYICYLL